MERRMIEKRTNKRGEEVRYEYNRKYGYYLVLDKKKQTLSELLAKRLKLINDARNKA